MTTNRLLRVKVSTLREIKNLQSTIKQIDAILEDRFDKGELGD